MSLESNLEAAAAARPGYEIAAFKEAGLPVSLLTIRVLTQEKKPLGAIDEGILRALDVGLENPTDLIEFLGLPITVLTPVLAQLNTSELVNYILEVGDSQPKITLTSKGKSALEAASLIVPEEKVLKVCVDTLTRKILFINPAQLYKPRDLREKGWFEVPTASAKRLEVEDIPLTDFDRVLNRGDTRNAIRVELLSIRRIERRELHFLPCVMLFYRSKTVIDDIAVAFWREDGPSFDHESKFREVDGPSMVGAKLLGSGGVEESKKSLATVMEQVAHIGEVPASAVKSQDNASPPRSEVALGAPTLQSIKCHEHPSFLKKALLNTTKRLLIVSPWIRDSVVDYEFVTALETLLRNKVTVHIGYGLAEGDGRQNPAQKIPITPGAERSLKALAHKYSNFQFVFIGNTHRKALISDGEFAIVTSFNWLSFKGDSKNRPRDEHGIVIRKAAYVDQAYDEALSLLKNGYSGHTRAAS